MIIKNLGDINSPRFETGSTIVENSNGLLPNEIYNQYYKKSSLNYLNQINIFGQLSNMYSFNTGYYNPLLYFSRSKKYVENNKLVFNNLENITSFNLSIDWLTNNIGEPNYLSPKTTQINYYRFMDNSLLSEYSVNQKNKPDVIDIEKFNHKDVDNSLFNQYWEKYKDEIQIEYNNYFDLIKDQNSGLTIDDIPNPFSLLLNKISIEKELDKNKYNEFDLFIEDLILSAYYELNYLFANKNIDIFNVIDFFNLENKLNILDDNDINKVKLKDVFTDYNNWSLTSKNKFSEIVNDGNIPIIINADTKFYDIQKKMQSPNNKYGIEIKNNLANNQLKYLALLKTVGLEVNKKIDFYNYLSNDNNDDFFNRFFIKKINDNFVYDNQNNLRTNNNQVYDYWTYLCLNDSSFFIDNNFQEVKVVSIYNSNALFITYNIVSIIIIAIGLILYNKKDFY